MMVRHYARALRFSGTWRPGRNHRLRHEREIPGVAGKVGRGPRKSHELSKLKAILSTGSPLAHHSFDYVYKKIKPTCTSRAISGGSDIISCFVLGNPILPVYRGEIQTPGLGMAVDVFDDRGTSGAAIPETCLYPAFPSMQWPSSRVWGLNLAANKPVKSDCRARSRR